VLLLLYGAGLRIGEAMGLTGAVLPLGETLRVTGKRGKTRLVPLLPQLRQALERYVALCPFPAARDEPLFRGARGGPLSPALIRRAASSVSSSASRSVNGASRCGFSTATVSFGSGSRTRSFFALRNDDAAEATDPYPQVISVRQRRDYRVPSVGALLRVADVARRNSVPDDEDAGAVESVGERRVERCKVVRERAQMFGIAERDLLDSPQWLIGSPAEMVDDLLRRRDELGISYVIFFDDMKEQMAPIVEELAGK